jgi:hypothetical protein
MCRNIKTLRAPYAVGVTDDDVHAAALQYVRTVGGVRIPGPNHAEAFNQAVDAISVATRALLTGLEASQERVEANPENPAASPERLDASPGNLGASPERPGGLGARPACGQAVGARSASPRSSSLTETSRMMNFCTLPVTVIGKSSVIRRYRGIL